MKYKEFQPTLWLLSDVEVESTSTAASVLTESSLYFIFSLGYLCHCDIYRRESGRCRTLSFSLIFFIILPFQVFLFINTNTKSFSANLNYPTNSFYSSNRATELILKYSPLPFPLTTKHTHSYCHQIFTL